MPCLLHLFHGVHVFRIALAVVNDLFPSLFSHLKSIEIGHFLLLLFLLRGRGVSSRCHGLCKGANLHRWPRCTTNGQAIWSFGNTRDDLGKSILVHLRLSCQPLLFFLFLIIVCHPLINLTPQVRRVLGRTLKLISLSASAHVGLQTPSQKKGGTKSQSLSLSLPLSSSKCLGRRIFWRANILSTPERAGVAQHERLDQWLRPKHFAKIAPGPKRL